MNPAAGKKQKACAIIPDIRRYFEASGEQYVIFETARKGEATEYIRDYCQNRNNAGEAVRFYSCGGDGTLMETVNGAFGYADCEVACIPCGSANDYIRNFGGESLFSDIAAQVRGTSVPVDAISCNGVFSLNICAIGMDADVAEKMVYFKHFPFVSGTMAYSLAVAYMFFHKIGRRLSITIEGDGDGDGDGGENGYVTASGNYLFALAANGQYYGGGRRCAPQAVYNDGILDFELIEVIGRGAVPGFLKKYNAGEHLGLDYVHKYRGKKMTVTSDRPVTIVVDGECTQAEKAQFEIHPSSMRFVLPEGCTL